MKRLKLLLVVGTVVAMGGALKAALIGITTFISTTSPHPTPDIFFISNNIGSVSYSATSASTGVLAVNAALTQVTLPGPLPQSVLASILGTANIAVNIAINTANASSYVGNGSPDDLRITGTVDLNGNGVADPGEPTNVLLTGGLVQFGWQNSSVSSDTLEFRFMATGGALSSYFTGQDIGVSLIMEGNNWINGTGFTASFVGTAKGDVVPIPVKGTIGDFVWRDLNSNGAQDAGEPGINGVTVQLKDGSHVVATQVTHVGPVGQNGFYQFSGRCGAAYSLTVTTPGGFIPTASLQGGNPTLDSDGSGVTMTLPVSSTTCTDQTIDFGFKSACGGLIGDVVWHDVNRNGLQDDGPGSRLSGVTVRLKHTDNSVIATTTTGANGTYLFGGLCAGTYRVEVDPSTTPVGFTPTTTFVGGADPPVHPTDSNPTPFDVELPTDSTFEATIDFGYVNPCTGTIGDMVWYDDNHNGIQDLNEIGLDGLTVQLMNGIGTTVLQTKTTAVSGARHGVYQFTGVCAGTYQVKVMSPAGFVQTTANVGDPAFDSSNTPATVTLPNDAASDQTIDFGYTSCAGTIGNFVWQDFNLNGIQDPGEPGFPGVQLILHRANDYAVLQTTSSGPLGEYLFQGLCPADYKVEVVQPAGTDASPTGAGTPATDSNGVNPVSPASLTLDQPTDTTIDFGFRGNGSIGDFVWYDLNSNGIQDDGATGINGITVQLKNSLGQLIASQNTHVGPLGQNGYYQFTNLSAGDYTVAVSTPAYDPTSSLQGGNAALDSNGSPTAVNLPTHTSTDQTIDFGLIANQQLASAFLGDRVWFDLNGNGIQDGGEPGIAGVTVTLTGPGAPDTRTTHFESGRHGVYHFGPLVAGIYTVTVATPSGYTPTASNTTTPDNDSNGSPAVVTLPTNNSEDFTIDFGFKAGSIGNFVWHDKNLNGIQDAGEPGLPGVTVRLKNSLGVLLATTVTGASGDYLFTGLAQGGYIVEVDPSTQTAPGAPTTLTTTLVGGDPTKDSNVSGAPVTLDAMTPHDLTVDFGLVNGQTQCPSSGSTAPSPCGTLIWGVTGSGTTGSVIVRYVQNRAMNDNSYGTGAVNWASGHTFGNLSGSDKAEFKFKTTAGATVLDFFLDYISSVTPSATYPSGYRSLGATGGDGSMVSGTSSWITGSNSSLQRNLNERGFCTFSGTVNCTGTGGTNLLVNSPPTTPNTTYAVTNSYYANWDFTNTYEVTISGLAFGGVENFGSVSIVQVHNSPAKTGSNQIYLASCPPPAPPPPVGGQSCSVTKAAPTFSSGSMTVRLTNTGFTSMTITELTLAWPGANGKLKQVKLGSQTIYTGNIVSPVTLNTALVADATKRTIAAGASVDLVYVFEKNANTTISNYSGTVKFGTSCVVTIP